MSGPIRQFASASKPAAQVASSDSEATSVRPGSRDAIDRDVESIEASMSEQVQEQRLGDDAANHNP